MKVVNFRVEIDIDGPGPEALAMAMDWLDKNVQLQGEPDRFSTTVMNRSPIHATERTNRVLITWSCDDKPMYVEDDSAF